MSWHHTTGIFVYGPARRLVVEADQGIADFYRALIPLYRPTNPQRYSAHVSVVRHEDVTDHPAWGRYEGQRLDFEYNSEIIWDETYYWLDVRCERLKEIRQELGLTPLPWWRNHFHLTIGNVKT